MARYKTHKGSNLKKASTHKHNIRIFDAHFWVYDSLPALTDENVYDNGAMVLKYQPDTGADILNIEIPLYSCWIDEQNRRGTRVCKAVAVIPENSTGKSYDQHRELAQMIYENLSVDSSPMKLIADRNLQIISYLTASQGDLYHSEDENWDKLPFYSTKAEAINATLEALKFLQKSRVTGLDFANLNAVSDGLMFELRFIEIKDVLRHGPSMWAGDPRKLLGVGQNYSRSGYNSWNAYGSSSYGHDGLYSDQDTDTATDEELANSFLDILERELG